MATISDEGTVSLSQKWPHGIKDCQGKVELYSRVLTLSMKCWGQNPTRKTIDTIKIDLRRFHLKDFLDSGSFSAHTGHLIQGSFLGIETPGKRVMNFQKLI